MHALTPESQITEALQQIGITADSLSSMSRIRGCYVSTAKLSAAMNGVRDLPREDAIALLQIISDLEVLIQATYPLPLSMKNPSTLCRLIDDMKNAQPNVPTLQDLILMNEVLHDRPLPEIAEGRGITLRELCDRLFEISVSAQRAAGRLSQVANAVVL
jgi:hypothetical protein